MISRKQVLFSMFVSVVVMTVGVSVEARKEVCTSSCAGGICTFRDIRNVPLGNATLALNDACQLMVDDIGGSGQDGVVQDQLQSVYMKTTLATPNLSGSLTGTSATIRQVGIVDGQPGKEIMLTRIVNFNDTHIRYSVDCGAVQVAGYSIDIYKGKKHVQHQDLGINPPVLLYPKEDLVSMACGIWPNGDVYTVFRLGSPQPISLQTSPTSTGPFTGDVVFVSAFSPQHLPTQQTAIENVFFATGPVTLASVEAGSLPGAGTPCSGDCAADLAGDLTAVSRFMRKGWDAIKQCAKRGEPVCPAPCPEFPTLEKSGVSPSCYNLLGCSLDELASSALENSLGADRCPEVAVDRCDQTRGRAAGELIQQILRRHRGGKLHKIPDDVAACHQKLQKFDVGCVSDVCNDVPDWIETILGNP
jgi:hypothetical protein